MEHTEIKDASVLVGQAILILRRKAEAIATGVPFLTGIRGTLEYRAEKLADMSPLIEHIEHRAAIALAECVEGK